MTGHLSEGNDEEEARKEPEVTREQVQELKAQGFNSLQVAAKLRCTLKVVHKYW